MIDLRVVANDESGFWEIHDDVGYVCSLEIEFKARRFVHCTSLFGWVTDSLREALTQLDCDNAEARETSRWAEWHAALAAAHPPLPPRRQ